MGMFDFVKFAMNCPHCANKLTGFQTKDKDCSLGLVEWKGLEQFYSHCIVCGVFFEYSKMLQKPGRRLRDYVLTESKYYSYKEFKPYVKKFKENEIES